MQSSYYGVIEKVIKEDKSVYVCFADLEKAFDTISKENIQRVLEARTLSTLIWERAIQNDHEIFKIKASGL